MEMIEHVGMRISKDDEAVEFFFRHRESYLGSASLASTNASRDEVVLSLGHPLLAVVVSLRPDLLERFPHLHLPVPDTSHDTPEMTERRRLLAAERQKMDDEREQLERDHDTDDD